MKCSSKPTYQIAWKIMAMFKSRLYPYSFHHISQLVIFEYSDFKFHSKTLEFQSHLHLPSTLPTGMLFYMQFNVLTLTKVPRNSITVAVKFNRPSNRTTYWFFLFFLVFSLICFLFLFFLSPWDKPLSAKVYYH